MPVSTNPTGTGILCLLLFVLCIIKSFMRLQTRIVAVSEMVLIFPAALFMTALVVRNFQSLHEPAHTAQRIVMWYSGQMWTLWVLLLALPFAVLVTGSATLLRGWNRHLELPIHRKSHPVFRARPETFFVAATTLAATAILVIVVLHMLAN